MRSLIITTTNTIITTALVSSLALSGCGGDDDDAAEAAAVPDRDSYCAELASLDDGEDPGFDQFFADHPEPTLEDWAAFLPGPIAQLSDSIEQFGAIEPATELEAEHDAVLAAMTAVRDSFQVGLDAAEAGDQAAFDANGQAPGDAMEQAMVELGTACGIAG